VYLAASGHPVAEIRVMKEDKCYLHLSMTQTKVYSLSQVQSTTVTLRGELLLHALREGTSHYLSLSLSL
jgi:hypothetical protein